MDANSITVLTWARNEQDIMPFFLRHYAAFADRIIVWDNGSDDRTPDIVRAHPKAELRIWDTGGVFDEIEHTRVKETEYRNTGPGWKIVVDTDEFIFAPDGMRFVLRECDVRGVNVLQSQGCDMIAEEMPVDDGVTQLMSLVRDGTINHKYSKICVFRENADIKFSNGCHKWQGGPNDCCPPAPLILLLHYHWLGLKRVKARARWMKAVFSPEQMEQGLGYDAVSEKIQSNRWFEICQEKHRIIREGWAP